MNAFGQITDLTVEKLVKNDNESLRTWFVIGMMPGGLTLEEIQTVMNWKYP